MPIKSLAQLEDQYNWILIKKYASRIISLVLLAAGVARLTVALTEIFRYTNAVQAGLSLLPSQYYELLKHLVVETAAALLEGIYGLLLLFKPSHQTKLLHIVIGAIIVLLNFMPLTPLFRIFNAPLVSAQTETSTQAIADYQFQLQKYRDAHKEYLRSKNEYLSFQTLAAQSSAIDKTKVLLHQRAEALKSYLTALRVMIQDSSSPTVIDLGEDLAAQETFLARHQADVAAATTIESVSTVSQAFESRYPHIQVLAYQTLFYFLLDEQQTAQGELRDYTSILADFIAQEASAAATPQINQWLGTTTESLTTPEAEWQEGIAALRNLRTQASAIINNQRQFNTVVDLLESTRKKLIKSSDFFDETMRLVKTR